MTAVATQLRWTKHGYGQRVRMGVTKILRGASWKSGWVIVAHDDRLMPYPSGGFNSSTAMTSGGPLLIAGDAADANGGLRIIAKQDKVRVSLTNGGAIAVGVTYGAGSGAYTEVEIAAVVGTSTANAVVAAVRANAQAAKLIELVPTGTGAGVVGAQAVTPAPFVRIYGISQGEAKNDDASNDLSFAEGDTALVCEYGMFKLQASAALAAPGIVYMLDNNTLQPVANPMLLPVCLVGYDDDQAICHF